MISNIKRNQFWFITGIETIAMGFFFLSLPNYITDTEIFGSLFSGLDDMIPALILIMIGLFATISAAFEMNPDWHRGVVLVLQVVWTLYAVSFFMHDLSDPHPPAIGFGTIFVAFVAVRIFFTAWLDDPGDDELRTVDMLKVANAKLDKLLNGGRSEGDS